MRIHADIAAKLNFAAHQSAFPVLRSLGVENPDAEQQIENLVLTLRSTPAFIREKSWVVDRVAPQELISIKERNLTVDGGFLLDLSDSVNGSVEFRLEKEGEVLAELVRPVKLLAYNEWGGAGFMPELLAAFSMPNDPAIDRILRNASEILRQAGKEDKIDGYQSRSRERVWEIASAIYSAIASLALAYAVPPASFERDGQKIRLPGQILDGRVATCLDTAMLFASAFEQAGLNPIIALPKGHALAGVWLQPEDLASIVIDETETLRKRIDLKELLLIETTFVTSHPAPIFSKALTAANDSIRHEHDDTFTAAVDIQRARAHSITPLSRKSGEPAHGGESQFVTTEQPLEVAPVLPDFNFADLEHEKEDEKLDTPQSRLERWKRKLLDLTLRNPLLNHRATKASLLIICPDPSQLEDKLAGRKPVRIASVPTLTSQEQDEEIHRQREGEEISEEFAREELKRHRVLVDLPHDQISHRAVEIFRKARTALEEGGANTLYLAFGFLHWKRDDRDDRRFRAPLILVPVSLERTSVRSGFKMTGIDDETRFNTTLLEMLRRDFRIEIPRLDGPLPEDKSGVDVPAVWNIVRLAVKDAPGFEVVEDVVLGHFSFAKYLMWKDLVDRTDALRGNTVVRHLLDTPHDPYGTKEGFVDPRHLDRDYKPTDLLTPLPADSSQMSAIATADRRKDFVIIGPPGTGKSQTIANLIAHLLGTGKTVLFLSEKTAALNVVFDRLKKIGLGRFCLELHSNKARKADVLKQLGSAWTHADLESEAGWQRRAEDLRVLRDRLNRLVEHLHRKRSNGLTAHHAIGVKVRDMELASRVALFWPAADQHDESALKRTREAVENLSIQAKAVGDCSGSPFQIIEKRDWTPNWQSQVYQRAGALSAAAGRADVARNALCNAAGIDLPDQSMTRLDALVELAQLLLDSYRKPTAFALGPSGPDRIEALHEAARRLTAYAKAQGSLSCEYDPFAWRTIHGQLLRQTWSEAETTWWPRRFFAKRRIIKEMRANGCRGNPNPASDAPVLARLRQEGEAIDGLNERLADLKEWSGQATDPVTVETLRQLGERARTVASKLADSPQTLVEIRRKLRTTLHDGNDLLDRGGSVGGSAISFLDAFETLKKASSEFEEIVGNSVQREFGAVDNALLRVQQACNTIRTRHSELRDWCAWRKRRAEAVDLNLLPLVEAVEQGQVSPDGIENVFEAAYCTWWSGAVVEEDEVLRTFSVPEHEAAIEKFRRTDDEFQKLTAEYVALKLSGVLPGQDDVKRNSQWGILRRELQKQRRHKPVRKLLEEAPDVLTSLTPCFMMSPLSVAQYLPADQALFDVVIFDEASQITVWDAVGSIARGKQVIVAGDPKQMPPTNFFARSDDDPDGEIDTEGDLESILEEMLGAGIPDRTLNLHYRSLQESLIAFSNDRYYGNSLITFPAPDVGDRALSLRHTEGFYARGGARHNEGEAKAIVDEIVYRLRHEDEGVRNRSIGVVTFNAEQQTLIEDLLDNARSKHPEIERAFAQEHIAEPVFVKNLETVQGDERDTVLFSVTYGPDRTGHVTMNFGPLNRQGGERRLNVAITRARREMVVFSTLRSDQLDLSRTNSRAVADLKDFLTYAESGRFAFPSSSRGDFESPFEAAVAQELRTKSWQVHPQVGVSSYRIDLGIVHPDAPGRYLAGIECDGAMYHSSAFARERDKIRQAVLENRGWKIFRVWSSDWWTNKEGAVKKLDAALHKFLEESRREQRPLQFQGAHSRRESRQKEAQQVPSGKETISEDLESSRREQVEPTEEADNQPFNDNSEVTEAEPEAVAEHPRPVLAPYPSFEGQAGPDPRSADLLHVSDGLCRIVEQEGPILARRAYDVYLRGCGIRRMGGELKKLMNRALQHAIRRGYVVKEDEWREGGLIRSIVRSSRARPVIVRERGPRKFDEIPPSELQLVARQLFKDCEEEIDPGSEAHLKVVLATFRLKRLTKQVGEKLREILKHRYSYVDDSLDCR